MNFNNLDDESDMAEAAKILRETPIKEARTLKEIYLKNVLLVTRAFAGRCVSTR